MLMAEELEADFEPGTVTVDETFAGARWNISHLLDNVVLVAHEDACCRSICQDPPCEDGECATTAKRPLLQIFCSPDRPYSL